MSRLDQIGTGLVVAAAIAVAGANVHREFFSTPVMSAAAAPPTFIKNWKSLMSAGTVVGDSTAPVKIIEFADLECPGCRQFYLQERALPTKVSRMAALVFVHYPLGIHRFAMPAAQAVECARAQNRFAELVDVVFRKQDSLGLKTWGSYGSEAGVRDTIAFARCVASAQPALAVVAGRALGKKIGVAATPTVIINGWRYSSPPYDSLADLITRFAAKQRRSAGVSNPAGNQ